MPLPIKEILNSKQQKRKCHKQMNKKKMYIKVLAWDRLNNEVELNSIMESLEPSPLDN